MAAMMKHPRVMEKAQAEGKCTIGGYDIPANTIAVINGWAIGRDTEVWDNPDVFEPERFSNISTSYTRAHFELIPFGAERRNCPGISFAIADLKLSLAYLLDWFDWKLPGEISPEELDMTVKFGATTGRKHNLWLISTSHVTD
ncbi:premnaspirodiene oxygenase-like [Olea europaea subsp. europaea]|uniref:Premnaspirodiene oxygenase-like n=1 Tax=Olea europaea subsp. europaea TaxID=158383 RepID=A0A8S0ULR9_OLEEU|nr:premnaspirodiene oxygenase-like [Olea europaea subsp. europaea]